MNIYLITNQTGFPFGTAAAKRVKMIGKALIQSGNDFSIFTNDLSHNPFNINPEGVCEDIRFRYLHGETNLQIGKFRKVFLYLKGVFVLFNVLRKTDRRKVMIYIYAHGNIFNLITLSFCKLFRLKTIEEVNEWDHEQIRAPFKKTITEGPMVKWTNGAIVISRNIENTVRSINPALKTITVPVLEDPAGYPDSNKKPLHTKTYCLWMGLVNGYIDDVLLIVEAAALSFQQGLGYELVISGPYSENSKKRIYARAKEAGLPENYITLPGYLSEEELNNYCYNASFYIIPLWNNEKSLYRFPTKMASFLFSGKPLITCKIGEVGEVLTHEKNTLFFSPGDARDLAVQTEKILSDKALYQQLCSGARLFAEQELSYHAYSKPLNNFFHSILEN